jgi:hypothetical protein
MNITIKIIKIATENKGKYQQAKVSYEETNTGKVTSKTLLSFLHEDVYKVITNASMDDVFTIEMQKEAGKDGKEYWQWVTVTKGEAVASTAASSSKGSSTANTSPRNTYETPEERAQKQVYIVRQSSIGHALETIKIGSKTQPNPQDVVDLAKFYEKYVFGVDAMTAITNMANDLPESPEVD